MPDNVFATTVPVPVRRIRPEVPVEVSDLVDRLMESEPHRRFPPRAR